MVCGTLEQTSPSAQTERRGDAGPVRVLLGGESHPPLLLFSVTQFAPLLALACSWCSLANFPVRCLVEGNTTSYGGQAMTLTLNLPPSVETTLKQCAAQAGQPVDAYVAQLVQNAIAPGSPAALLAAIAAAPHVPSEWVDELEQLIAQGQRAANHEDPFAPGAKS
jgi:hypothetical protein